jgi:hypothetical protein
MFESILGLIILTTISLLISITIKEMTDGE